VGLTPVKLVMGGLKRSTSRGVVISLSDEEMEWVRETASRRHFNSIRDGRCDMYGAVGSSQEEGLKKHLLGAAGELAFAKAIGVKWEATVDTFKSPDVCGVQVRTRSSTDWDLLVRKGDKDNELFALVVGTPPKLRVVGGMRACKAKKEKFLGNHGNHGRAYFVPQDKLGSIEDMIKCMESSGLLKRDGLSRR
jgi:hypothetical protein